MLKFCWRPIREDGRWRANIIAPTFCACEFYFEDSHLGEWLASLPSAKHIESSLGWWCRHQVRFFLPNRERKIWSDALLLHNSCNWLGGHASVLAMDWYGNQTLHNTPFTNITIHGGDPVAAVQNVDNFSFAYVYQSWDDVALTLSFYCRRVYQAGHEIVSVTSFGIFHDRSQVRSSQPAFQPEAALEIFRQVINGQQLHSVDWSDMFCTIFMAYDWRDTECYAALMLLLTSSVKLYLVPCFMF